MPDPAVMKGVVRHLRQTERRRLYDLLGDGELLTRFLSNRDESAFEELVSRHGPMVRAVCRRVLGPTADADDAFQAAFLVLLRKARSIRRADLLANWLCAVAYRTARQALRRRYRLGARERPWDELPEPHRPDVPPRDWLPLFDAALQRLPSKYREPVVLCELQGLARPEAAKRLGLNEGTLSSRLGRARDLLRRKLGPYGFPLAVGTALAPAVVPEALTASTAAAAVSTSAASVSAIVLTEGVLTAMFASKLKAGAACTAVLLVGTVTGLQLAGPATVAGGPARDIPVAKAPPKEAAKAEPKPGPDVEPTRVPAEYEPFQGEWAVINTEREGGTHGTAGHIGIDERWKFIGQWLVTGGELKQDAFEEFTVNARAKPPTIDFTLSRFNPDGTGVLVRERHQGIYRFDGDGGLTICYRTNAEKVLRPTRFGTAQNSGAVLITLRPVPPAVAGVSDAQPLGSPRATTGALIGAAIGAATGGETRQAKPTDKDTDLARVIGPWELEDVDGLAPDGLARKLDKEAGVGTLRADGNPGSRNPQRWEGLRRLYLLPGGGPVDLTAEPRRLAYIAYVELNGTKAPKWINLTANHVRRTALETTGGPLEASGKTWTVRLCGIYKLDGNKLVLCLPEAETSPLLRPTEFKGDGEGGLYVLTYRRPAKPWQPESQLNDELFMRAFVDSGTVPPAAPALSPPVPDIPAAGPPATPPAANPVPLAPADSAPAPPGPVPTAPTGPIPIALDHGFPVGAAPNLPTSTDVAVPERYPTQATAPAPDLDRLQGTWVAVTLDGKPFSAGDDDPMSMEILKDRVLASDGKHGRLRLDEAKTPRRITFEMPGQPVSSLSGIYKLEGDRLTIASHARSAKLIPIGFDFDPEAGIRVIVYERAKGDRPLPKNSDAGANGGMTLPPPRASVGPAPSSDPMSRVAAPAPAADVVMAVGVRSFRLPYTVRDDRAVRAVFLCRSDDRGRTWVEADRADKVGGHFDVTVPKAGTYWFALQVLAPDGKRTPADHAELTPLVKVKVESDDAPPARDLQKEVDQLREQLKRMEKELKDRKPEPPATAN